MWTSTYVPYRSICVRMWLHAFRRVYQVQNLIFVCGYYRRFMAHNHFDGVSAHHLIPYKLQIHYCYSNNTSSSKPHVGLVQSKRHLPGSGAISTEVSTNTCSGFHIRQNRNLQNKFRCCATLSWWRRFSS
jgi:hypothetical protein